TISPYLLPLPFLLFLAVRVFWMVQTDAQTNYQGTYPCHISNGLLSLVNTPGKEKVHVNACML
ncbi:MAG: hypothetical protein AB7E65_05360, partial [Syntrophotalea sp.]